MKNRKTIYSLAMEYVDIVDVHGRPTGKTKTKEEAHIAQERHPGAHVWMVNSKGDILFQKRSDNKKLQPNKWDVSASGHISSGELPVKTAIRETQEELGLSIKEEQLEHLFDMAQETLLKDGLTHKAWNHVCLAEVETTASRLKLQQEEVSEAKFIPYRQFESLLDSNANDFVSRSEEYQRLLAELRRRYT
jgi:isopentenyldiphosphate isomerase